MSAASIAAELDDALEPPSIVESEIPEVRDEARAWLVANNKDDQKTIAGFAVVLVIFAAVIQTPWALVLAGCIALVLPFRWAATPHFRDGDMRRGILWTNLGTWYLVFPLVLILPDALPIAISNVIGPMIIAGTYLERSLVRRMVPSAVAVALAVTLIALTTDGVGLIDDTPRWVYLTVLLGYVAANLLRVLDDIQESNRVHLRSIQRAVQANTELREADQALRDSRRRLLVAADEERIRLERNLHDGAQQRLVSLALQLRLAAELADDGEAPSGEALHAMCQEATEAVEELRDLAQGVYPARLTELGLARALHAVARRSAVAIEIDDRTEGEIEQPIEAALYFVCLEAIQNATKHGEPSTTIRVGLSDADDCLRLAVSDDGPGFDPAAAQGSRGLQNMTDRVSALDGELTIESTVGVGTTVTATVPVRVEVTA